MAAMGLDLLDRPWIEVCARDRPWRLTHCTWRRAIHRVHSGELVWRGRGRAELCWSVAEMNAQMGAVPRDAPCALCGGPLGAGFSRDHIIPRVYGGPLSARNFRPVCATCNQRRDRQGRPAAAGTWWIHAGILAHLASFSPDWLENGALLALAQALLDRSREGRPSRRYRRLAAELSGGVGAVFLCLPGRLEQLHFHQGQHRLGAGDGRVWPALACPAPAGAHPHGPIVVPAGL